MSGLVKANLQIGDSATATQNFVITAAAGDGTMKFSRGNFGATTADIFTVDATGAVGGMTLTAPTITGLTKASVGLSNVDNVSQVASATAAAAALAATGGAALVGYATSTVADRLNAVNLADYAALRAYSGSSKTAYVTGYQTGAAPKGISGEFTADDSDTTSVDNGGSIIVATNGIRWKLVSASSVRVKSFGTDANALLKAVAYLNTLGGGELTLEAGRTYTVDWSTQTSPFLVFTNLTGVTINPNGAKIVCTNSASATKVFMQALGCVGFDLGNGFNFTGSLSGLSATTGGEIFLNLASGTRNVSWSNLYIANCYRGIGCNLMSGSSDQIARDPSPVSGIYGASTYLLNVYYGFYAYNSGNNVSLPIWKHDNSGRTYYVVNVSNHKVNIDSSHGGAFSDCLLSCQADSAYSGIENNTIKNIDINYSTDGRYAGAAVQNIDGAAVQLDLININTTPIGGAIKKIDINFSVNARAASPPSSLLTIRKWYNSGTYAAPNIIQDTVGSRGHVIKAVKISGHANNWNYATNSGLVLFADNGGIVWTGETINTIAVEDFNLTGNPASGSGILLNGTGGSLNTQTFILSNVISDGLITYSGGATSNLSARGVKGLTGGAIVNAQDIANSNVFLQLTGGTTAPTTAVTTNASYSKIGNVVTISASFMNFSTVGGTGDLTITGLPYTPNGTYIGAVASSNIAVPGLGIVSEVDAGSNSITFKSPQNSGSLLSVPITPTGTGRYLFLTIVYTTV